MTPPHSPDDLGVRPIDRSVLVDDVYEAIKALVMDHAIAPGGRIGIDALARELDVSPTPVREALARLEAERLVTKEPLKGYRTTRLLTLSELRKMFEFRLLLEPWAAGEAARQATDDQRAAIIAELTQHGVVPDGVEYSAYRELTAHDQRLHHLIFEAADNPHATYAFKQLHVHLHLFRFQYGTSQGPSTVDEHLAICDAIRAADAVAAADAMRAHLHESLTRLELIISNSPIEEPV